MWSFLNNRGPVTVSPNNYPGITKIAGFHVGSNLGRGILDLASNPCHREFPDFINRSNSASQLVSVEQFPNSINRSKSASELGTCTGNYSMGGKSDDISPSSASLPNVMPANTEKPVSPSPKKRRCSIEEIRLEQEQQEQEQEEQQQEQQQQQQQQQSIAMDIPVNNEDKEEEEEEDFSSDAESVVSSKGRQRTDSATSDDSFIVFAAPEDGVGENEDEEDDEDDEDDSDDSDSELDSDSSSDDDEEICFEDINRCTSCIPTTTKRVHWAPDDKLVSVRHMLTWKIAHWQARIGPWMTMALDRDHFQQRIRRKLLVISPILNQQHRLKIYEERFKNGD